MQLEKKLDEAFKKNFSHVRLEDNERYSSPVCKIHVATFYTPVPCIIITFNIIFTYFTLLRTGRQSPHMQHYSRSTWTPRRLVRTEANAGPIIGSVRRVYSCRHQTNIRKYRARALLSFCLTQLKKTTEDATYVGPKFSARDCKTQEIYSTYRIAELRGQSVERRQSFATKI